MITALTSISRNCCLAIFVFVSAISSMPSYSMAHEFERVLNLFGPGVASGTGLITFDLDLITMRVQLDFLGLTGNTIFAHIHASTANPLIGTAPFATQSFLNFPLGVKSGSYDRTLDLTLASSYDPAFLVPHTVNGIDVTISDALNKLVLAAEDQKAYLSIKTTAFPNGEISGFLTAVPEPTSFALMGVIFVGLGTFRRRRRQGT